MLVLLPPSESKRDGGTPGTRLDLDGLVFPELASVRRDVLAALESLSADPAAAAAALKLGPTQLGELDRNRAIRDAPTMPAVDRYDGVLFDALDAASLPAEARAFAGRHVAIASALFGLTGALDHVPAYRLSADSRVTPTLKRRWAGPLAGVLAATDGLLLDLRSAGYVALGALPDRADAVTVRVVAEDVEGRRRALNHFNKHGKGSFVRKLVLAGIDHPDVESLLDWARSDGIRLDRTGDRMLDLVV